MTTTQIAAAETSNVGGDANGDRLGGTVGPEMRRKIVEAGVGSLLVFMLKEMGLDPSAMDEPTIATSIEVLGEFVAAAQVAQRDLHQQRAELVQE
jgi:hypothetical protein